MNKKFALAWFAVFAVWMGGSYLVHGVLLKASYAPYASMYRTTEATNGLMPYFIAAYVVMAAAFVLIYRRGVEARPWMGQGLRFGLLVALLTAVPWYTIYYTIQPLGGMLVVKQIALDTTLCLLLGLTVATIYKNASKA